MEKVFDVGDTVIYNGQQCVVTCRNSMTLSTGGALHRYNLRGNFGSFFDIVTDEIQEYEGDA